MVDRYRGIFAAALTPMKSDTGLDLDRVGPLVEHLLSQGVRGLYVCGSTGEGISLTSGERRELAAEFVQAAGGRVPVLVQVGHNSLAEAQQLAEHAAAIGAAAISAACPSYFKIDSVERLVESMAMIASGAPELPFYYYHIPSLTGNQLSMPLFLQQATERIANLAGMKYTTTELHVFQRCCELQSRRFEVLWGVDEMLLGALSVGARAAIGSTYNIAAPLYNRLMDAFEAGDWEAARGYQLSSVELVEIISDYPFHGALKRIMELQGVPIGPCRLPQAGLSAAEAKEMEQRLREIGFFDWSR